MPRDPSFAHVGRPLTRIRWKGESGHRWEELAARTFAKDLVDQGVDAEDAAIQAAQRMVDRSHDLVGLANDALSRQPPMGGEPLNDDRRDHPDAPAQKLRHPRDVRILPPSRDFH